MSYQIVAHFSPYINASRSDNASTMTPHNLKMPHRSRLATTFSSLLRHCCRRSATRHGQQTHTQILTHGLLVDPTLQTDLILLYSRCSQIPTARKLFDEMPLRTMHAWNILISSYVQASLFNQSFTLFSDFVMCFLIPDRFTLPPLFKACAAMRYFSYGCSLHCWAIMLGLDAHLVVTTSVLDMYVKFERMGDARKVFDEMGDRDVVVWNSMIAGFARAGLAAEAMDLFRRLQCEGGERDVMAIPSVLSVCGKSGGLRKGKEVHGRVMRCLVFDYDVVINNSLIEMYAKCGCLEDSYKVFLIMGDQRNLVTWSTLISCYGVHGKGKEALALYNEMIEQGFEPNSITFTSILSSCSHSGLVDEGRTVFDSMSRYYGLEPSVEHYACMVDLLGRAGHISEALRLIEDMPMETAASVWGALLSACSIHRNIEVAEIAAHKLFELEPGNSSNFIALCGIYEMVGMLDNVAKVRARMKELGMVKMPGCSWINMKGRTHAFYQGDVYFPCWNRVCLVLDGLCTVMTLGSLRDREHELDEVKGSYNTLQ